MNLLTDIYTNSATKLQELITQRPWNSGFFDFNKINRRLKHVPTMLTIEERKMLNWIARYYVSGRGHICDLGAFVGGSTIQLADGLKNNKNDIKKSKIYSYDRFVLDDIRKEKFFYTNGIEPFEDTNAMPLVKDYLKNYNHLIKYHQGDFLNFKWEDGPIEILFIDISKTWELSDHISEQFLPNLIPGKSIVVQQDMLLGDCPWITATMYKLRDHFQLLTATERHSVLFLNTKQITQKTVQKALHQSTDSKEVICALEYFIDKFNYVPHKEILGECLRRYRKKQNATKSWQLTSKL